LGRSRGGLSTKIHLAVDSRGRPVRFILTPGQTNDCTQALALLDGFTPAHVIADKAYDTLAILEAVEAVGARPIIPKRSTTHRPRAFDPAIYRRRNLVERTINKLKQLRRIATRYDRNPRLLLAFLCLAALSFWA
jgi:transposase